MVKNLYSRKPESPGGDTHSEQQGRVALRWGKVVDIAPEFLQARVEVRELDESVSFWLPILQRKSLEDKYYWCPDLDERVYYFWDEQGEEGVIIGSFYNAEVPLSEAYSHTPHMTAIEFGDESLVYYDREEHEMYVEIRGAIEQRATDGDFNLEASEEMKLWGKTITLEACEKIVIRAPEIVLEGSVTMAGGGGGFLSLAAGAAALTLGPGGLALGGSSILGNGIPLAGIGGMVQTPVGPGSIISTGLGLFGGGGGGAIAAPECPEPVEAEDVEVELQGDLGRLHGYTPPGWGGA